MKLTIKELHELSDDLIYVASPDPEITEKVKNLLNIPQVFVRGPTNAYVPGNEAPIPMYWLPYQRFSVPISKLLEIESWSNLYTYTSSLRNPRITKKLNSNPAGSWIPIESVTPGNLIIRNLVL